MRSASYVFESSLPEEGERLALGERLWDGGTIELLAALGVGSGWSCLELGAGGGSIARWLAGRVGPRGTVVATDLRVEPLAEALHGTAVEVRRHVLGTDPLPRDAFDLIHARLVLQHLPERARIVATLAGALRPGGVLLLEDTDVAGLFSNPAEPAFNQRVKQAAYRVMQDAGYDPVCGLRNVRLAAEAGLVDVQARGRAHAVRGGTPAARWYELWLCRLRPQMVGRGYVTGAEVEAALAAIADPSQIWLSQVMLAVTARRPG
ncbi:methyltransferase [Actinoplanes teichomyceticus]|nr:methyltransferase [Actinoplanes teichomyceticus]